MTILEMDKTGKIIVGYKGFCFEILKALMQKYDFRVRLVPPYDGNWGALENGTWNGMVGMVNRSEVDMAVSGFTISYHREQVIDFTRAFHEEPSAILLPAPRPQSKLFALVQPFSWQVWLAVCTAMIGVAPFMYLLGRAGRSWVPTLYPHPAEARPTYSHIQWYIFGGIIGHGDRCFPASLAPRVLLAFWWCAAITIMASYTGTLIAFLTVPSVADSISSLEELASQNEIKWTYRIHSSMDNLFKTSSSAVISKMRTKYADSRVENDDDGVKLVLTGKWAFVKERSFLDFALADDFKRSRQCRLQIAKREFYTVGFGWVLQTGSVLKELFDREFLRMHESGLFIRWRAMYEAAPSNCSTGAIFTDVGIHPLAMTDLVSAFLLLMIGAALATAALIAERAHRTASERQGRRQIGPVFHRTQKKRHSR